MIFARRVASRNGRDEWSEDFEAVEVPRAAKVAIPVDGLTDAGRRRTIKLLAIKVLRDAGFRAADVAVAVEMSPRHVKRRSAILRAVAESQGRV